MFLECHLQINRVAVIDMQHCSPLIHQQFTKSNIQVVMAECSHLRATATMCDQYEYIFSYVEFGKVPNRKNIIEVPWLVLFLYNKMSINNSFVQRPIVFVCDL